MKILRLPLLATVLLTLLHAAPRPAKGEPPLTLSDLAGQPQTPLVVAGRKAAVLIFLSPFCPTSNTFTPEANRIAAD